MPYQVPGIRYHSYLWYPVCFLPCFEAELQHNACSHRRILAPHTASVTIPAATTAVEQCEPLLCVCFNGAAGGTWMPFLTRHEFMVRPYYCVRYSVQHRYYLGSTWLSQDQPLTSPDVIYTSSATCVLFVTCHVRHCRHCRKNIMCWTYEGCDVMLSVVRVCLFGTIVQKKKKKPAPRGGGGGKYIPGRCYSNPRAHLRRACLSREKTPGTDTGCAGCILDGCKYHFSQFDGKNSSYTCQPFSQASKASAVVAVNFTTPAQQLQQQQQQQQQSQVA